MNSSKGIEQPRGLALAGARCQWGCCRTFHRGKSSAGLCSVQPTPPKGWGEAHLSGVHFQILLSSTQAGPAYIPHLGRTEASFYPVRQRSAGLSREGPTTGPQKAAPSLLPCLTPPPTLALSEVRGRRSAARRGARTFQAHPHRQALLEAAEGTALALRLVDLAALALGARVVLVVLHRALEEALGRGESAWWGRPFSTSWQGFAPHSPALASPPRAFLAGRRPAHLAALACEQPVVVARHLVPTHGTQLVQVLVVRIVHARGVRLRREEGVRSTQVGRRLAAPQT